MKISQGIYEHYKSTKENPKFYQVLFLSHMEESLELLVHYQPLYWDESNDNAVYKDGVTVWTRTHHDFCKNVEWNGITVPRFKRVS